MWDQSCTESSALKPCHCRARSGSHVGWRVLKSQYPFFFLFKSISLIHMISVHPLIPFDIEWPARWQWQQKHNQMKSSFPLQNEARARQSEALYILKATLYFKRDQGRLFRALMLRMKAFRKQQTSQLMTTADLLIVYVSCHQLVLYKTGRKIIKTVW